MSDRPKWMPSEDVVDRLVGGISELEPFVSAECQRTGLRAQIAKLEEMVAGQTGHWVDRIKGEIERLKGELG